MYYSRHNMYPCDVVSIHRFGQQIMNHQAYMPISVSFVHFGHSSSFWHSLAQLELKTRGRVRQPSVES